MDIQWSLVLFTAIASCGTWVSVGVAVDELRGLTQRTNLVASVLALVLAVVGGLVIAFAETISAFVIDDDPQLIELTASHFLPLLACAPFGFLAQVASAYFQAVGQERISILLGVCRYLLFAIPMIVVLAAVEGLTGVWWSQPPADLMAAALAVALAARECGKLRRAGAAQTKPAPESEPLLEAE